MVRRSQVLLKGLAGDRRGNVLMMVGAGLFPVLAMLGGGFDLARAYLIKSRLQQACDAAVLGGRSAMGNKSWNDASRTTADKYFSANFNAGRYGILDPAIRFEAGSGPDVRGFATATVPFAIMSIFGFDALQMSSTCEAKLDLPNADIMFVLDNTLSMGETNAGDSVSRLRALQNAVKNFYAAIENSRSADARVRYGFVPYSSTVNVGMLLRPDWLADRWTYQSRVADGTDETTSTEPATRLEYSSWRQLSGTSARRTYTISSENCVAPANTSKSDYDKTGPFTDNPDGSQSAIREQKINGISNSVTLSNGVCTVTETTFTDYVQEQTVTKRANPNAGKTTTTTRYWWKYQPIEYELTLLKGAGATVSGGRFSAQIGNNHTLRDIIWNQTNACIEERQTAPGADPMSASPSFDVDVDTPPSNGNAATQWRPLLPSVVYSRKQGSLTSMPAGSWGDPTTPVRVTNNYVTPSSDLVRRAACPAASRKLGTITAAALDTYVGTFRPAGMTYHDIGFLWGLRLLSAQGLFASENQALPSGKLARHLIFMTDGQTETNIGDYDAYGLAALDRRRTPVGRLPTDAEQNGIVDQRLAGLCRVAAAKGITVWVVAFGTSLTSGLRDCATDGRAFEARNAAELEAAFAHIAGGIAQLRLVK